MTEDVPSDLSGQVVIDASFADPNPRPSSAPPQEPHQVRTEDDLSIRSILVGTLLSGMIVTTCIAIWAALLAAPILALRSLLQ